ncbi:intercellular trafficking and secretion, partial [Teratosphaeriaceae sp. CCFEE 6253]
MASGHDRALPGHVQPELSTDELLHGHWAEGSHRAVRSSSSTEPFPPLHHAPLSSSPTGTDDSWFADISPPLNEAADDSDSDYELVAGDIAQADNGTEASHGVHSDLTHRKHPHRTRRESPGSRAAAGASMEGGSNDYGEDWQQAGPNADAQDLAGPGLHGRLQCQVSKPQKEGEGTQNAYVSYLVTTDTDFKSYQSSCPSVRRRFTDFVFLAKTLLREYP